MARLESRKKMGHYPTPEETLLMIRRKIQLTNGASLLDPCCGDGFALFNTSFNYKNGYRKEASDDIEAATYGIELDTERVDIARSRLRKVVSGSIYETMIRPLECFSALYLNPPYDYEDGNRMEYLFLKHSHKWLKPGGVLLYLVPESILYIQKVKSLLRKHFKDIEVYKFTRNDYPRFKQIVLFGIKRGEVTEEGNFPSDPYLFIEDGMETGKTYVVPTSEGPKIFELRTITQEDIQAYHQRAMNNMMDEIMTVQTNQHTVISPIFPLRKGHLVSLLMSGVLNGKLISKGKELVYKCFTDRDRSEREEEDKHITTDRYISGIRVIERGQWYDVT